MADTPDEEDKERMYNHAPKHGQSLHDFIDLKILQNANRLKYKDSRKNLMDNWVFAWRKAQIDNTEYIKEAPPDISKEAIVKHAFNWFDPFLKEQMEDYSLKAVDYKQKEITEYIPPARKKGGWYGDAEGHRKAAKKGWRRIRARSR